SESARPSIYLDYQASTPVDPRVLTAMMPFMTSRFANPHSSDHVSGWRESEAVTQAARTIAAAVGVDSDEVVFTSGATEANNLAVLGLARRAPPGRTRILVSAIEHKCVLAAARATTSLGFSVEHIPVNGEGLVDLDYLNDCLREDVLLVSVM